MVLAKQTFTAVRRRSFLYVLLTIFVVVAVQGGSCPMTAKCPLDGAQALLVNTEYEGIVAIGVYEHTTTTGETHRFRMRCN